MQKQKNIKILKINTDKEVGRNDFRESTSIYYQDLKRYHPISKEEEKELLIKAKAGDIEARNKVISSNLRFVFDIAKKYRGRGVDMSELISEGNDAMFKAIEKFDVNQDVKFFSYAVWWIRQRMDSAVKNRIKEEENVESFDEYFNENERQDYLDTYNCEDDEVCSGKDIQFETFDTIENNEEVQLKQFVIKKLLSKLDDREQVVIKNYYGLNDGKTQKMEEIGKELNLCVERVRQLKVKAINEMRSNAFNVEEAEFLFR